MVAKLSSVRIIVAASLETSVPVIPMAIPMSAFLSAGASFTPSPVIATMSSSDLSVSTSRTLSSGVTRAITPISSIWAGASSSLMAAHSAPVIARPSMPSFPAIAAAVTAWSPVIMRTWIPADFALAIAAFACGRGGSTIPTSASSVSPSTSGSRSAFLSNVPGSKSLRAVASTRRPCSPSRVFSSRYFDLNSSFNPTGWRSAPSADELRASSWSGAPLTKARTTSLPSASCMRWNVAISL